MTTPPLPASNHVAGDTTHVADHNTIVNALAALFSSTSPGRKGIATGFGFENALNAMSSSASQAVLTQIAGTGAAWLRIDYQWTGGTTGTTRNGANDTIITQAVSAGLNIIAVLGDATNGVSATDGFCGTWMANAVTHLASLGCHVYEVQNEMNLAANWGSGSGSSGQASASIYVNTLKAAYPAIHAADPAATVLHCGLAPYGKPTALGGTNGTNINAFDFFTQMYTAGAQGYFDAANFHLYTYPTLPATPDGGYNMFVTLNTPYNTMVANGDGWKKIWITEFGVATGTDAGYSSGNVATQAVQAQVVTQGYQMAKGFPFTGPCLLFDWQDNTTDGDFGVITSGSAQKTAYAAFVAV